MLNKLVQTSNTKPKKEKDVSKKSLAIINTVLSNNIELSKHKSHEIYGQYSPSNLSKSTNNNLKLNNNNQKKNNTLANTINKIIHYSGAKKFETQNNSQNLDKNNKLGKNSKSKSKTEYKTININDISNNININNNLIDNKNDNKNNEIRKSKKNNLDKILSESDSCQEIDSMEEESLSKGMKSNSTNLKGAINYKKHLTAGINSNNKKNEIKQKSENNLSRCNNTKKKTSGKKKTQKLNINDDNEETDDEIIVDDNEFENSKFFLNDKLKETKFPKLSSNPFIGQKNNKINNEEYRKSISSKEYGIKTKYSNERQTITTHHIKSTTLGTVIISGTNNNSSTLSNIIDLMNLNNNNNTLNTTYSKKEMDNNNMDNLYRNFLLISQKGDKDKFLELLDKINSLPKEQRNINYQDENGYSALHYACDEGNLKIVEILLNSNCDTNIKNNDKQTPLHLSSKQGFFDISKKLIENGALLNIYDSEKNSPIHYACKYNHVELLKFFLGKLPQVDSRNIYGKMPIELTDNKDIKNALIEYLKKNANSYHKIKIYQTTDTKMKNLIEKKNLEENNNDNNKNNKRINTSLKKSKNSSLSPSNKNKGNKNKLKILTQDYNSVQITSNNIKKKNIINEELKKSKYINKENDKENNNSHMLNIGKVSPKNGYNKNNNKWKTVVKNNELKSNTKSKDNLINSSQKIKKENINNNNNNNIKKNQKINEKEIKSTKNNITHNNLNGLKKTKTVEQFSSVKSNNNITKHYNQLKINNYHPNKRNDFLNDSKLNNSNIININNSINNELNRINLSFKNKERTKINKSITKENNTNPNSNTKNSPKNKNNTVLKELKNKKLVLDQTDPSINIINLNKTEESINNVSTLTKKSIKKIKSLNPNKNKDNTKNVNGNEKYINNFSNKNLHNIENKDKKSSGSKKKKSKKQVLHPPSQYPNYNIDNSYTSLNPTNCNISKISTGHKNNKHYDSMNKINIIDQTLPDNIHVQLNLNSIEEEHISPSSFICLAQLGKGSFGEVYLVQKINTKEKFAMKVLRKERIMGQNLLKYAIAERNVLSLSNHPFIVKLNFAFQTSTKLFLILEYCPNGDLAKHLLFEKRFSEERAKFYICEILLALENLHQRDIIFRDLKPDNVVLDEEGHCKLTDFGLSKEGVNENQSASSFCGSIAYLAPEMLKKQGHGKAVDWYLLGVLLYEMLVGITPFFTARKEDIFHNIEFGELKIPEYIQNDTASLLRGLLQKDPKTRLGGGIKDADEIKEHPYFKDVNWDDVYNKRITPPPVNVFTKNIMHVYQRPRLFANDDNLSRSSDKPNPNMLPGWSFINNEE